MGPFGLLVRMDNGPVVVSEHFCNEEVVVQDVCTRFEISLLGRDLLNEPVGLSLFKTETGSVRVYQALFTDSDLMPWEYWREGRLSSNFDRSQ